MIKIFQICLLFFAMLASSSPAFAAPLDDYKAKKLAKDQTAHLDSAY